MSALVLCFAVAMVGPAGAAPLPPEAPRHLVARAVAAGVAGGEGRALEAETERLVSFVFSRRFRRVRGALRIRIVPDGRDLALAVEGRDLRPIRGDLPPLAGVDARLRLLGARAGLAEGRLSGGAVRMERLRVCLAPEALVGAEAKGGVDLRELVLVAPGAAFRLSRWKPRKGRPDDPLLLEGLGRQLHLGARTGKLFNRSGESLLGFRAELPSILPGRLVEGMARLEAMPGGRPGFRVLLAAVDGAPLALRQRFLFEEAVNRRLLRLGKAWEDEALCRFWCATVRVAGRELELAGPALVNVDGELWEAGAAARLERRPPGMGINPLR